jgi:hypothetical protein
MEPYPPELLTAKDVILAEVHITWYRLHEEDDSPHGSLSTTKTKKKAQAWDTWRAHLELKLVSLIAKAPKEAAASDDNKSTEVLI